MNERRFELLLTWVLLGFALVYGVRMYTYPSDAGRVPSIVAAVMVGALVVQLVTMHRFPPRQTAGEPGGKSRDGENERRTPTDTAPVVGRRESGSAEPEPDSYETLIALTPLRQRRFWTITGFAVIFAVGIPLVGFVVTAGLTVAGILLFARERPRTVVAGAAFATAAAYGLVVGLIGLSPLHGLLIG
jgi:hypothetical protein